MKRTQKKEVVASLLEKIGRGADIYFLDIHGIDGVAMQSFRDSCFRGMVSCILVKNKILLKTFEVGEIVPQNQIEILKGILIGSTMILFGNGSNKPALLLKQFYAKHGKDKPILKAAYVQERFFMGKDQLDVLQYLKSKEELVIDILNTLRSPWNRLVHILRSVGSYYLFILKQIKKS